MNALSSHFFEHFFHRVMFDLITFHDKLTIQQNEIQIESVIFEIFFQHYDIRLKWIKDYENS